MTSAGLGAYADNVALAKKALMSDPADANSLAARLSSTNGAWLQFAKDFNLAKNGLDRLYDRQQGFEGKWNISLQRNGETIHGVLDIAKVTVLLEISDKGEYIPSKTSYQAKIDGEIVPATDRRRQDHPERAVGRREGKHPHFQAHRHAQQGWVYRRRPAERRWQGQRHVEGRYPITPTRSPKSAPTISVKSGWTCSTSRCPASPRPSCSSQTASNYVPQ